MRVEITALDSECESAKKQHYCLFVLQNGESYMLHGSLAELEAAHDNPPGMLAYSRVFLTTAYPVDRRALLVKLVN